MFLFLRQPVLPFLVPFLSFGELKEGLEGCPETREGQRGGCMRLLAHSVYFCVCVCVCSKYVSLALWLFTCVGVCVCVISSVYVSLSLCLLERVCVCVCVCLSPGRGGSPCQLASCSELVECSAGFHHGLLLGEIS